MKKILPLIVALLIAYLAYQQLPQTSNAPVTGSQGQLSHAPANQALFSAMENRRSDVQLEAVGTVVKILADDNDGSRHQRFLIRAGSGPTVLVAHNIDLAPRVADLVIGDIVTIYGEYEWNPKGGVLHWTHHDPAGRHVGGWIKHEGQTYQ
ncbi:MAG: DUF3465 domain-containing protein [Chromatiales bacterium]|nr:DUF3465 domain-containing protein [Chromatiales bacterium]